MAAPNVTILWNSSQSDVINTGGDSGDSNWKVFDALNDKIAFTGASLTDEAVNTTPKDIFAIPESGSQEVSRQFVNDYDAGQWDRVWLAGSDADQGGGGNTRYVYGAYVDGTTASAPVLQAWDSTTQSTYNLEVLGSGTPSNSMLRAVGTTYGHPGSEWAGTPIAGGSNTVALDSTALDSAKMVYWNMRMLVPSTSGSFATEPVLVIYMTYA
ncbi:MAG TPA: hypothetical protein VMW36_10860 [Patescibacteria group bacterium]|nr:hypothetical protein [Patescibacteria group bacterium]